MYIAHDGWMLFHNPATSKRDIWKLQRSLRTSIKRFANRTRTDICIITEIDLVLQQKICVAIFHEILLALGSNNFTFECLLFTCKTYKVK